MDSEYVEHLEIEVSRTREALTRYLVWHNMDHDSMDPGDIQSAYDEALSRAREVISGNPLTLRRASASEFSLYRVELLARDEWCSSTGRFNWLHEAKKHGEESGGQYRIFHLIRGCTCREDIVFDSTENGSA